MPNCPKCGSRVSEAMSFCPNCGAALKPSPAAAPAPPSAPAPPLPPRQEKREKEEKTEKGEKREKAEKGEKYEKRGGGRVWLMVAGIVLILIGLLSYIPTRIVDLQMRSAYFLIIVGVVIIIAVIIGVGMASRRNPPT